MKRLRSAFVTGLLVVVPILVTINVLTWVVKSIDDIVRKFLPERILAFDFFGLGVIIVFAVILVAGILTENYIGKWFVTRFDHLLRRFPVFGGIYGPIKKVLETIFNPSSDQFKEAVVIEFPIKGSYSIGFRTGAPDPKLVKTIGDKSLANIFVPLTPNVTSGYYVLVPESDVIPLKISVQEAFKILVSMGIVTTDHADDYFKPRKK